MNFLEIIGSIATLFIAIYFINVLLDKYAEVNRDADENKRLRELNAEESRKPESIEKERIRVEQGDQYSELIYMYMIGRRDHCDVLRGLQELGSTSYWSSEKRLLKNGEQDSQSTSSVRYDPEAPPWEDVGLAEHDYSTGVRNIDDIIRSYDAPIADIAILYIAFQSGDLKYGIPDDRQKHTNEIIARQNHWITKEEINLGSYAPHQNTLNQIIIQFERLDAIAERYNTVPIYKRGGNLG